MGWLFKSGCTRREMIEERTKDWETTNAERRVASMKATRRGSTLRMVAGQSCQAFERNGPADPTQQNAWRSTGGAVLKLTGREQVAPVGCNLWLVFDDSDMQRIEQALRATLNDHKLSRSERSALAAVLGEVDLSEQQRGVVRSTAFDLAREVMTNDLTLQDVLDWLEDVLKLIKPAAEGGRHSMRSDACFSPGESCRRRIANLFRHARQSVDVCVFTITDNTISDEILTAHRRGVAIRIISDNDKSADRGSDIPLLERLGVPVRMDLTAHHMHHKFALFDDQTLLTGSYNWTVSASEHNEENLIVTDDAALVRSFREAFDRLWQRYAPRV